MSKADESASPNKKTPTLIDQLDEPEAGFGPVGVSARCISCKIVRAKRLSVRQAGDSRSFKHVCHNCRRSTWWNIIRVLVDDRDGGHE